MTVFSPRADVDRLVVGSVATPPSPPGGPAGVPAVEPAAAPSAAPALAPARLADRLALAGLLVGAAVLYLWGLSRNGWANAYYSAAVQAGATDWKAFFFGSFDAANAITVDKAPASLWVMDLSVRLFGLSSWSILVPQALMGVAAVTLLYAAVARWFGRPAGLLAGAVLAMTPVAVLMFRFNNPDALLVLLLVAAAYAVTRALEGASTRWLLLAGALVGLGFLSKMLQAFLVLPAFSGAYLLASPTSLRRRLAQSLAALAAVVVAGGWWVAVVELWPASSRPYIGGSQTNSVVELLLGYNGVGRLTGNETGSVVGGAGGAPGGPGGGAAMWGPTGWDRLLSASWGGQIAWLLPAATVLLVAALVAVGRAPRTDRTRAALVLWGGWLVVTALTFSYAAGIIHEYYAVALAPAIGAVVAIGATVLWRRSRDTGAWWPRAVLAVTVAGTGVWAAVLLARSSSFLPWLRPVAVVAGFLAAGVLLLPALTRLPRAVLAAAMGLALVAGFVGPTAYAVQTAATAHEGSLPSAGPQVTGARGPGGMRGPAGQGLPAFGPGQQRGQGIPGFGAPGGQGFPGFGPGQQGFPGFGGPGGAAGGAQGGPGQTGPGGAGGGLLGSSTPSAELTALLLQDADRYTWVAASVGANRAAGYQLATQRPVLAIGGFNGSDHFPSLEQFQQWVAQGRIHWFLGGGGFGGQQGGSDASSQIAAWVEQSFTAQTVDGLTVYDLTT